MDIKKPAPATQTSLPASDSRQTPESHSQTNKQADLLNLRANPTLPVKTGQLLELLVIKLTDYDAILEIVGTKTQLRTADTDLLQPGQRLKAQITSTEPILNLKVLSANIEANTKLQSLINTTLRQIMPGQQPLKNLLDNIQQLTKSDLPTTSPLQAIKDSFIQSIPPSQAFESAEVLPEILKRSGMFTEHVLQKIITESTQNFPNNDLKISLLRLADKLRNLNTVNQSSTDSRTKTSAPEAIKSDSKINTPAETYSLSSLQQNTKINPEAVSQQQPRIQTQNNPASAKLAEASFTQEQLVEKLLNHTEGALSRLQTLQLQHLQHNDIQKPSWIFELPIRTESSLDNVNIYIEQDDSGNKASAYTVPWKVILEFNIQEFGALQAHIVLQGTKVSVNFWVENKLTSALFSDHLNLLETQLSKAGLATGSLNCHCDKAPSQPKPQQTPVINETL